jgi:hypothetical protein
MLEMADKDGHTKLISADDLNWSFLHK